MGGETEKRIKKFKKRIKGDGVKSSLKKLDKEIAKLKK